MGSSCYHIGVGAICLSRPARPRLVAGNRVGEFKAFGALDSPLRGSPPRSLLEMTPWRPSDHGTRGETVAASARRQCEVTDLGIGTLFRWPRWARTPVSRSLARRGEREAARYLRAQGLTITDRNARVGRGEIDLVGVDEGTLVFVEVKSRSTHLKSNFTGLEAFDARKRRALRRSCWKYYRELTDPPGMLRLDAVTVTFERRENGRLRTCEIKWYPAFLQL